MFGNEFYRIYELRNSMKNPDSKCSCLANLDLELQGQGAKYIWGIIERDLQGLDVDAWAFLKNEALQYVNSWNEKSSRNGNPRGRESLLNILYQAKAYNFLKTKGCSAIHFIPRAKKDGVKTPDLEATDGAIRLLCEVKTFNRSEDEVYRQC